MGGGGLSPAAAHAGNLHPFWGYRWRENHHHLVGDNPHQHVLEDPHRQQEQVPGERQLEKVGELEPDAKARNGEAHDLIQVGVLVLDLQDALAAGEAHQLAGEHQPAAHAALDRADHALDKPSNGNSNRFTNPVHNGAAPLLILLRHHPGQHGEKDAVHWPMEHLTDAHAQGDGPGELDLERGQHGQEGRPDPAHRHVHLVGVLAGHEEEVQLARGQPGAVHLLHVGDAVAVVVAVVVLVGLLPEIVPLIP
mmetsp:Transcript_5373/g.9580  ORF Transcript_5373/g.9580 Transcript_5373/m.9580 type:complete len:251 (-) Transcript_5373:411-1163(-)